jgi:hypothetical protein
MFEGFYFEFPKLIFLFFIFLGCANLCPLRTQMLYFPHISHFGNAEVTTTLWMWASKWLMIILLITALMSPVKEVKEVAQFEGYNTLIVADSPDETMRVKIASFIDLRASDSIAMYIPKSVKIPLTKDHKAVLSILNQIPPMPHTSIDYTIKEFFFTQERSWIVIFSDHPESFVHSIPTQIETSVVPQKQWRAWMEKNNQNHSVIPIVTEKKQVEYLYFYPLFFGFMAMLLYLFGRNQRGLL